MNLFNERNKLKSLELNQDISLENNIKDLQKEIEETKQELNAIQQIKQKLSEELDTTKEKIITIQNDNMNLFLRVMNLEPRKVPNEHKHDFTYMVYIYGRSETQLFIKIIRRQTCYLTSNHIRIRDGHEYLIHEDQLPISMTLNKRILKSVKERIPQCINYKNIHLNLPIEKEIEFVEIVRSVIASEVSNTH
jgi:seryl-tRNA synthetase